MRSLRRTYTLSMCTDIWILKRGGGGRGGGGGAGEGGGGRGSHYDSGIENLPFSFEPERESSTRGATFKLVIHKRKRLFLQLM